MPLSERPEAAFPLTPIIPPLAVALAVAACLSIATGSSPAFASAHSMFEDEAELRAETAVPAMDGDGAWNRANNPRTWSPSYEYRFQTLPLGGRVQDHTPWSDTYWPSYQAGIAARWNSRGDNGFKYPLWSEASVRAMPYEQLARLSPAEKYDIFMGRFDYPTVSRVRASTSPRNERWAGICHGWSPAALNHLEPAPVTAVGASGIAVPFGSADVKALLDDYYAENAVASHFLGLRCGKPAAGERNIFRTIFGAFRSPAACKDVNAGAFHVILANELGLKHQGFVADVDRARQVWNQPVYAFSSRVVGARGPSPDAAEGTVREILVHTEMTYALETEPLWQPVVGTPHFKSETAKYDYALELDASGRIIGGQYYLKSNPARPDFLWSAPRLQFTGYAEGINRVYRAAQPSSAMH